jgi:hypothetical protein
LRVALAVLLLAWGSSARGAPLQLVPEIDFRPGAPASFQFAETGAAGRQNQPSRLSIDFDVVFEGFFQCQLDGHMGVMLRASLDGIANGRYRGHGAIFGNVGPNSLLGFFFNAELPGYKPLGLIETWGVGYVPANFRSLMPRSASPQLQDWTRYKISVQSTHTILNYVRYRIHRLNIAKGQYELVFDTGDVLDNNWAVDMGQQSVVFFDASLPGTAACPYTVRIINPLATWSGAEVELPDLTSLPWGRPGF